MPLLFTKYRRIDVRVLQVSRITGLRTVSSASLFQHYFNRAIDFIGLKFGTMNTAVTNAAGRLCAFA